MPLEEIEFPDGTQVHIGGMPFIFFGDTVVLGVGANRALALKLASDRPTGPTQAGERE